MGQAAHDGDVLQSLMRGPVGIVVGQDLPGHPSVAARSHPSTEAEVSLAPLLVEVSCPVIHSPFKW